MFIILEEIGPRSQRGSSGRVLDGPTAEGGNLEDKVGSGRATLRLKQNGPAVVEEVVSCHFKIVTMTTTS